MLRDLYPKDAVGRSLWWRVEISQEKPISIVALWAGDSRS